MKEYDDEMFFSSIRALIVLIVFTGFVVFLKSQGQVVTTFLHDGFDTFSSSVTERLNALMGEDTATNPRDALEELNGIFSTLKDETTIQPR